MTGDRVLELAGVKKAFGETLIIRGTDLAILRGEKHALIGPNGAGKSTLFNLISGRLQPTSGSIKLFGREIGGQAPHYIARLGLSRGFQTTSAFNDLTVAENLAIAAMRSQGESGSVWKSTRQMARVWDRVDELLRDLNLAASKSYTVARLPYSEQRLLELGLTLASDPAVLLIDEPTAGMSRADTDAMISTLLSIAQGRTLILIEHDMNVVFGLADRISVLVHGQVVATGTPAEVRNDSRARGAYLGVGGNE
jgi:ABC-type branched-chain amino acid transport systems, ATPase component